MSTCIWTRASRGRIGIARGTLRGIWRLLYGNMREGRAIARVDPPIISALWDIMSARLPDFAPGPMGYPPFSCFGGGWALLRNRCTQKLRLSAKLSSKSDGISVWIPPGVCGWATLIAFAPRSIPGSVIGSAPGSIPGSHSAPAVFVLLLAGLRTGSQIRNQMMPADELTRARSQSGR